MHKLPVIIILLFGLLFTGCGQAAPHGSVAASHHVTIDQALADWKDHSVIILDVRTPSEYAEGHIPGAKLIPLDQLPNRLNEVPKEGKVYVICRSGNRSSQATNFLRDNGFSNVFNVTSGMTSWRGPVEK